jgi:transcriptional regulator with XRE-family HTH domain
VGLGSPPASNAYGGTDDFRGLLLRFRGRTRLTQAQLAARASVHMRSLQGWESGISFPGADSLQKLIVALLQAGAFTAGSETAEAEALWMLVERESSRQHPSFDAAWFAGLLVGRSVPSQEAEIADTVQTRSRPAQNVSVDAAGPRAQDWGEAPDTVGFLGRRAELQALTPLLEDGTRLLLLSGLGGVGKTTLAARISQNVAAEFQRVYWRSMRDAPSFSDWSGGAIGFLADHQQIPPEGDAARTEVLIQLMRAHRYLLVLDNLEALLQPGRQDGSFRPEYMGYAAFLSAAAERNHPSVVLVTTREVPAQLMQASARVVEIGGLELADARLLLSDKELIGNEDAWSQLVARYGGNGLALRVVGEAIRHVFGGDIATFMEQAPAGTVFTGIRRLLDSQFTRLSPMESEILQYLAIAREPVGSRSSRASLRLTATERSCSKRLRHFVTVR